MPSDSVIIRPAATVLILRDDPFRVLMVKRHAKAFLGSALVFPGGVVEPADASPDWLPHLQGAAHLSDQERAFRIAACREVFEETSILLATASVPCGHPPDHISSDDFLHMVRGSHAKLTLGALEPFAHWVTPDYAPKRVDTRFFVCQAPAGHKAVADGAETVSLQWISPAEALASANARESIVAFPTRLNLKLLAESDSAAAAIAAARERPPFTVRPWRERADEGTYVRIPLEAGYGVTGELIGHDTPEMRAASF